MLDESLQPVARLSRGTWKRGTGTCLVCLFAFLASTSSAAADQLIMRDGKTVSGTLKACISGVCQLGAQSIPWATIASIGLGTKQTTPPAIKDPAQDEVQLADGTVHDGNLIGVSMSEVVMQEGSFDRAKVTWIHLAGAPVQPKGSIPTQEPPPNNPPPPPPVGGKLPPGEKPSPPRRGPPLRPDQPLPSNDRTPGGSAARSGRGSSKAARP
jgi:hypothetical protein